MVFFEKCLRVNNMRNAHFTALQVHTSGAFLQGFVIRVMQETPVAKSNTAEVHKAFFFVMSSINTYCSIGCRPLKL